MLVVGVGQVEAEEPNEPNEPEYLPGLVAHLKFEGNVVDRFGQVVVDDPNLVNLVGDANFVDGAYGQALTLDGDGDYVNLGPDFGASVLSGLKDFSASVWVKGSKESQAASSKYPRAFQFGNADNSEYIVLSPFSDGTPDAPAKNGACGGPRLEVKAGGSNQVLMACLDFMNADEWNNIVVTLDTDMSTAAIYINGVPAADTNDITNHPSMIGTYDENTLGTANLSKNKNYLNGSIDDLRIYNYALSAEAAASLAAGLVGYYPLAADASDASGLLGQDGVPYGDPNFVDTGDSNRGLALELDGIDDFVVIPQLLSPEAWTVAFWLKTLDSAPDVINWYQGKGLVNTEAGGCKRDWGLTLGRGAKVLAAYGGLASGCGTTVLESSIDVNDNEWHHIAYAFAKNDTQELYLDGALDQASETEDLQLKGHIKLALIGAVGNTNNGAINDKDKENNLPFQGRFFTGSIDEVLFYDRPLSAEEVLELATQ